MKCDNRGSNTLAGLFATGSGVLFAMLMADAGRYVIARSAVYQAAEEVTRCLTPTDPACVDYSAVSGNQLYDWYGVNSGIEVTRSADRYNYIGTVKRQRWELSVPGYEIHKVPLPPVVSNLLNIPIRNFRAALNNYERRYASIQANFDELIMTQVMRYAPLVEPSFPEFHPLYEQQLRWQPAADWQPIRLNIPGSVTGGYSPGTFTEQPTADFPTKRILSGDSAIFETGEFEVPELKAGDDILCLNSTGSACDISYAAGGAASDMWSHAHVAIKAFAEIRKVGAGSMEIRWAGSPWNNPGTPDGYGLSLVKYSKSRFQQYKAELQAWQADPVGPRPVLSAQDEEIECLGGSAWDEVNQTSWINHHLVLRGAIERSMNDEIDYGVGRSSACPGGDNIHWDLKVERGGAYKIRGWIKARSGSADVKVKYRHFIDGYSGGLVTVTQVSQGTGSCNGEFQLDRDNPNLDCKAIASSSCSLTSQNTVRSCSVSFRKEAACITPETAAGDPSYFEIAPASCGPTITAAVCEVGWTPAGVPSCSTLAADYPNRSICGWTGETATFSLASINLATTCSAATPAVSQISCGDGRGEVTFRPDGNYGSLQSCPNVVNHLVSQQQLVNQINNSQPSGATTFAVPTISNYSWGLTSEFNPPRWVSSILPHDELGDVISDPLSIRDATVRKESSGEILRHNDPNWTPPLSAFALTPEELSYISSSLTSFSLLGEEDFQIRGVYPFANRPEFDIPTFIPSPDSLQSCTGTAADVGERLKHYANAQISGISSNVIWFEGSASFVDSAGILSQSSCSGNSTSVELPRCTITSDLLTRNVTCSGDTYLGRTDSGSVPSACQSGDYSQCRSEYVSGNGASYEETIDLNLARAAGLTELRRAYPTSVLGCDDSDCSKIEIDLSAADRAKVTVSYNLPLSFPLKSIVGAESLTVTANKQDLRELALVGRRNE